jgi:hypothetical protein
MISIRFGIPGKYWLPWLCPASCSYYICPIQYQNALCCTLEELDHFEQSCMSDEMSFLLTRNLRVESFDGDQKIVNRHAHTCIMLVCESEYRSRKEKWRMFLYNLKAIDFLYSRDDIPVDITRRIEQMVWKNCGELRRRLIQQSQRLLHKMVPVLAEKMLAPDYVWRTGKHTGRTTISVLSDRWHRKIDSIYP